MNLLKSFSRRSFFIIFLFMILLFIVIGLTAYYGYSTILQLISNLRQVEADNPQMQQLMTQVDEFWQMLQIWFIPVSAGLMILFTFMIWFFLRIAAAGLFKRIAVSAKPSEKKMGTPEKKVEKKIAEREKAEYDRRIYLYMLSVLQREGRFLDFLSEDLDQYDDSQIGAAVRSIHQSCKKVVEKNIAPRPLIDKTEGGEIVVEAGFDPSSIKLTGNVSGEPPFSGVLRHKGWQAKKIELPTLSNSQDSRIIAPAEIEVLEI